MSKMTIVRTDHAMPDKGAMEQISAFLFKVFDGATKDDRGAWRRFWKRLVKLSPGEMANAEMLFPRSGPFHRFHFQIEQTVFNAQDRFSDFEMFRDWLKIGAAWVVWVPGAKGGIVPLPKSVSYAKADEEEFRKYHKQVMEFLRGEHAAPYLWKHLGDDAHEMMRVLLEGFDRVQS